MKTNAWRLYGKKDLRLETFELPLIGDDEILARVVSDSLCMSSYKAAVLGPDHKRVPDDVATNPVIIGHEFCGEIVEVGKNHQKDFHVGQKIAVQPAIGYKGSLDSPGYSFPYIGGDATYIIIPSQVMEMGCLLPYEGEAFFYGSLAEPMSCIVGAYHASYHTKNLSYVHEMGIKKGGHMALLAGAGPMGLGAIDYALHCDRRPSSLVVTDIDAARLARAEMLYSVEEGVRCGVSLTYVNTAACDDPYTALRALCPDGYDDVFVYAPVQEVIELGGRIMGRDGCLNFFAGPIDSQLSAKINFYDVHYSAHHLVGTSGGNTQDMIECLELAAKGRIDPAAMITHVGGMDCVGEATLNLPQIAGGKKLIYTHIKMPLTALEDFAQKGKQDPLFAALDAIIRKTNGLWSAEAEAYLLENGQKM